MYRYLISANNDSHPITRVGNLLFTYESIQNVFDLNYFSIQYIRVTISVSTPVLFVLGKVVVKLWHESIVKSMLSRLTCLND